MAPLTMKALLVDMMPCLLVDRKRDFLECDVHFQRADSILQHVATSGHSSATLSFITGGLQYGRSAESICCGRKYLRRTDAHKTVGKCVKRRIVICTLLHSLSGCSS